MLTGHGCEEFNAVPILDAGMSFADKLASLQGDVPDSLTLIDGSRIAVIGGGPAGSLFTYFLLRMAENVRLEVDVDIYEPRHFTHKGPAGCNHCGGVVSESLVQILAAEGVNIPAEVVQRGIDSYTLHLDTGTVRIATPLDEKRIAAVYRGNGPRDSEAIEFAGFDGYLQQLATSMGARCVRNLASSVERIDGGIRVGCPDGLVNEYDLVVVATGVNSHFLESIEGLEFGYRPPEAHKTFICEFELGRETIEEYLGTSMHVFLLDLPGLTFAAIIPKGDLVTMCVLGDRTDEDLIDAFVHSPEVKRCFPGGQVPSPICHCFPRMNVKTAAQPFADRVVIIGDMGTTRLYKDGIGGAYRTAKAAARTIIFQGISEQNFREHYWPACKRIEFDNGIGRLIFFVTRQIQKWRFLRRAVFRMTAAEQRNEKGPRRMSGVLWDVFTGSAPYKEVLLCTFHPGYVAKLAWYVLTSLVPFARSPRPENGTRKPR